MCPVLIECVCVCVCDTNVNGKWFFPSRNLCCWFFVLFIQYTVPVRCCRLSSFCCKFYLVYFKLFILKSYTNTHIHPGDIHSHELLINWVDSQFSRMKKKKTKKSNMWNTKFPLQVQCVQIASGVRIQNRRQKTGNEGKTNLNFLFRLFCFCILCMFFFSLSVIIAQHRSTKLILCTSNSITIFNNNFKLNQKVLQFQKRLC